MEKVCLSTKNITIEFPGVLALSNVNFEADMGMVHAVVGANGAGKSTLMNANSHFLRPAGPHFPASQGHIKRPVLDNRQGRDRDSALLISIIVVPEGYAFSINTVNPVVSRRRIPSSLP